VAWTAFTLLGALWTFATPIGAAPDEPAHLIRASSIATGQLAPFLTSHSEVTVPRYVFDSQRVYCFALVADRTPTCVPPHASPGGATARVYASSGRYNPLYYALVGWPSIAFHTDSGIYAMRLAADVLMALFLGLSFALIVQWRRPLIPLLGLAAAVTPMVVFLGGVVNPNSLEISATLATFVGMLSIVRDPSRERIGQRAAIVFVAASVAANMRGLSLIWVALAILAPLILTSRRQLIDLLRVPAVRLAIAGCAVFFGAAIAWMAIADPLGLGDPGATGTQAPVGIGTSHLAGFLWTFFSTFYYGEQVVGVFGWLAVPSPPAVYFAWSLIAGVVAVLAIIVLRRRALWFGGVLLAALLLLPAILQGIYVTDGGVIWQGRYVLPVFACAMVGLATVISDRITLEPTMADRIVIVTMAIWAGAQFLSFATTLKRYAVGSSAEWPAILHPLWSPPGGVPTLIVSFAVLVVAAGVGVVLSVRRTGNVPLSAPSEASA
jgi:hypothetical protein